MDRSCLSQHIQPVRLHMETTPHGLTRILFQSHVAIPEKPKCFFGKKSSNTPASFPSSTVFMCLTINFPWKKAAWCPPAPIKCFQWCLSASDRHSLQSQAGFSSSPQPPSTESSILKLLKINIGIIALHSPQTTFVLKWRNYLFSAWIFWWVFSFWFPPD